MPTPEEVDEAGAFYGPMDIGGRTATISRCQSDTFEGRPIPLGRWYHLLSTDGVTSLGMIEAFGDEFYAYKPYEAGEGWGRAAGSLNEAIRLLATDI
jgi:hypothetical protein